MTLAPDITIECYVRTASGVPSTTTAPFETAVIARGLQSYQHTISATFGFESLQLEVVCDIETALHFFDRLLMPITVSSPDAQIVWDGFLYSVTLQAGDDSATVSLDTMANRVTCRYATYLGGPGIPQTVSDTSSQAIYGRKDTVITGGTTASGGALNAATRKLAEVAYPRDTGSSTVRTGAANAQVRMTLQAVGWYETLKWLLTSNTSTTSTSTTTQIGTMLTTVSSTNNFISTSTAHITASGVSDTENIPADTSYFDKFETLLKQGNSSGDRLAWGVYEGRLFYVDTWAGVTPTVVDYQRRLDESVIRTVGNSIVPWWDVRPNRMYQRLDLLDLGPTVNQVDTAGRFAIERVTCGIDNGGVSLTLEGPSMLSSDAFLAQLGGG